LSCGSAAVDAGANASRVAASSTGMRLTSGEIREIGMNRIRKFVGRRRKQAAMSVGSRQEDTSKQYIRYYLA
jgi:hypothetical protein